jgi:hypothetical protein
MLREPDAVWHRALTMPCSGAVQSCKQQGGFQGVTIVYIVSNMHIVRMRVAHVACSESRSTEEPTRRVSTSTSTSSTEGEGAQRDVNMVCAVTCMAVTDLSSRKKHIYIRASHLLHNTQPSCVGRIYTETQTR